MTVAFMMNVMSLHEAYTLRRIGDWPTDFQLAEEEIHVPLKYMSSDKN